ncbi:MAG: homoserine kinase [Pseudomonadota bacterium]
MSKVTVYTPASIGNVGPGFDVLGLALDGAGDTLTIELVKGPSKIIEVTGKDADKVPTDASQNATVIAAEAFLRKNNISAGVHVWCQRSLPISGGLGSSAAAATGGALSAALASGLQFTDEDILECALAGEAHVAGKHLDNIAPCYFGGLTAVLSTLPPVVQKLPHSHQIKVVVITPDLRLSTKDARAVLPSTLSTQQWTQQMSLAIGLAAGLASGEEQTIKNCLKDPFAEKARSPLIPHFEKVKAAALEAGALGCSISGAGPTLFALVGTRHDAERIGERMRQAFLPIPSVARICQIATQGAHRI